MLPAAQKVCMTGAIPYPYRQARMQQSQGLTEHQRSCMRTPISGHAPVCSSDIDAPVQDSDFLYLTGINQQAVAVLEAASSRTGGHHLTLFIPDATPQVAV